MQHSEAPFEELEKAKKALKEMQPTPKPPPPERYEALWKTVLVALERVWSKASSHFGRTRAWKSWAAPFVTLRNTDHLLAYVKNARDTDEHTIEPIVDRENGEVTLEATREEHFDRAGNRLPPPPRPARLIIKYSRMRLLPVKKRDRTYPVPDSHLGKPIDGKYPLKVAEAAIRFYEDFLNQAEERFVK